METKSKVYPHTDMSGNCDGNYRATGQQRDGWSLYKCDGCGKVATEKELIQFFIINPHQKGENENRVYLHADVDSVLLSCDGSFHATGRQHEGWQTYKCDGCGLITSEKEIIRLSILNYERVPSWFRNDRGFVVFPAVLRVMDKIMYALSAHSLTGTNCPVRISDNLRLIRRSLSICGTLLLLVGINPILTLSDWDKVLSERGEDVIADLATDVLDEISA